MIDTVASILAPLLGLAGGGVGDAAVLPSAMPPPGHNRLSTGGGRLDPVSLPQSP